MAGFQLSQISPAIEKIVHGRAAATRIFKIIDRNPTIVNHPNAITPSKIDGIIKF